MPLGFSGGSELIRLGERYGNDLANSIQQTGKQIETGLQRVTTQRQLQGLGATLSNIDPRSPDYTQKLMQVGTEFPFAMQDPRGQAMMAMGAKEHFQWQEQQQAAAQANSVMQRQSAMENTRFQNDKSLLGVRQKNAMELAQFRVDNPTSNTSSAVPIGLPNGLPKRNNPAAGINFGAGMPSLEGEPQGVEGNAPLPTENLDPIATAVIERAGNINRAVGAPTITNKNLAPFLLQAQSDANLRERTKATNAVKVEKNEGEEVKKAQEEVVKKNILKAKTKLDLAKSEFDRERALRDKLLASEQEGNPSGKFLQQQKFAEEAAVRYEDAKKAYDEAFASPEAPAQGGSGGGTIWRRDSSGTLWEYDAQTKQPTGNSKKQ